MKVQKLVASDTPKDGTAITRIRAAPRHLQGLIPGKTLKKPRQPFEIEKPQRWLPKTISPLSTLLGLCYSILPAATAQDLELEPPAANCTFGQGSAKPGNAFPFKSWVNRGHCVRQGGYAQCRSNLLATLGSIDNIHAAEYSASASVLALLPTIGALFGTPTSEIWTMLTVLPFGGSLAILLSFGGTIMPTRIVDYQTSVAKNSIWIESTKKRDPEDEEDEEEDFAGHEEEERLHRSKLSKIKKRIHERVNKRKSIGLPRKRLAGGLISMVLLFCAVMIAMGIVEYGAVYSDGCTYNWWFHMWYIAVTISTILDNWAQLPFRHHWKLYISSIPYDIEVTGGEPITSDFDNGSTHAADDALGIAIKQLKTIKPGSVQITSGSSKLTTKHRNAILVLVSVARNHHEKTFWRTLFQVFTKALSVTVFVFGTCVLSAVSLLAMPMAQLVLMMILAAGVGSRVIAGGIVTAVAKNEPMLHVITENEEDAFKVMAEIFELQQQTEFQLELDGHIFCAGRRVAKRSGWFRRVLGVMASPFDMRRAKKHVNDVEEVEEIMIPAPTFLSKNDRSGLEGKKSPAVELMRLQTYQPYEGT